MSGSPPADTNLNQPEHLVYVFLLVSFVPLLIAHTYALLKSNYHKLWISPYTLAVFLQAISVFTLAIFDRHYQLSKSTITVGFIAQHAYVISIEFFILFLLIVAKGWPITRQEIPSRSAFIIFLLVIVLSDIALNSWILTMFEGSDAYHSLPKRLTLILRAVIMLYFLLELRTTMILEQEQKKLKFYLHFGALSMVWFVHPQIVYLMALRVSAQWQQRLLTDFTNVANFLALLAVTFVLWPDKTNEDSLFNTCRRQRVPPDGQTMVRIDVLTGNGISTINGVRSDPEAAELGETAECRQKMIPETLDEDHRQTVTEPESQR